MLFLLCACSVENRLPSKTGTAAASGRLTPAPASTPLPETDRYETCFPRPSEDRPSNPPVTASSAAAQTEAAPATAPVTPPPTSTPTPTASPSYNGNPNHTDGKIIVFSHPSGFYSEPFILKFTYHTFYTIRYTVNGDLPTATSRIYNDSGIAIEDLSSTRGALDKTTVVRAAAFSGNIRVGEVVSATYIVNRSCRNFEDRYQGLAVISIITDRDHLYHPETGIFYGDHYTQHGRESERPAHIEFFDSNGYAAFSINAGMRVYGGTSRGLPQKSLKLTARKEYDAENGKFKYPLLPQHTDINGELVARYDSVILRAGGNDNLFGGDRYTFFRDALIHGLAGSIPNIDYQAYRPVVVYINGQYWGVYNMRDDLDNDYLEQHYGVPKEQVAIVAYGHENGSWFHKVDAGTEADWEDLESALNWIAASDMTAAANYSRAGQLLDLDNFMKYMAINMYVNNADWPGNNTRMWKYTGSPSALYGHDGKWRFMLKDIDYSMGLYNGVNVPNAGDITASATGHNINVINGNGGFLTPAFSSLLRSTAFRSQFVNFVCDLANMYYSPAAVEKMTAAMKNAIFHEYDWIYSNIWNGNSRITNTKAQWLSNLNTLTEYANERPEVFLNMIAAAVLKRTSQNQYVTLEIRVNQPAYGTVSVSTLTLPSETAVWTGTYFKLVDIPLTAQAAAGHTFLGFTCSSGAAYDKDTGTLYLDSDSRVIVTANFS